MSIQSQQKGQEGGTSWDFRRFVKTVFFYNPPQEVFQSTLGSIQNMLGFKTQQTEQFQDYSQNQNLGNGGVNKKLVILGPQNGKEYKGLLDMIQQCQDFQVQVIASEEQQIEDIRKLMQQDPSADYKNVQLHKINIKQDLEKFKEIVGDLQLIINLNKDPQDASNLLEILKQFSNSQSLQQTSQDIINPNSKNFNIEQWGAIDDVVMGGMSSSNAELQDKEDGNGKLLVFKGNLTTANSGGFASIRNKNFTPPLDMSAYDGLELRYLGNGLRFKVQLRCDSKWDGVSYSRSIDTKDGEYQTKRIPFSEFQANFRAKLQKDAPPVEPKSIVSFQLMLSKFEYNGELNPSFRTGQFQLPIEYIKAYSNTNHYIKLVQFVQQKEKSEEQSLVDGILLIRMTDEDYQMTPNIGANLQR